jgi:D-alanyl-D-alanine carboxypeptidase (penicillin-binding protein 5/6)
LGSGSSAKKPAKSRSLNISRVTFTPRYLPPKISATNYCIINATTGEKLWGFNDTFKRQIASMTKIMTCYVVIQMLKNKTILIDEEIQITRRATATIGTTSRLRAGDTIKLKDLLYGLMLPSGNDAAIALAMHCGGYCQFISQMNIEAENLGL